jgi:hypothetical protein
MRQIPGYPDYEISVLGQIFNLRKAKWSPQHTSKKGYKRAALRATDGEIKTYMVHRLVCLAYLPNPNNYPQVNHKNGIKADNRLENLEWCTGSMNQQHAYDLGLKVQYTGEDHGRAKLTWPIVRKIRKAYATGRESFKSLSSKYGVCKSNIEFIVKNRTWVS